MIKKILLGLVCLFVIALVVLYFFLDSIVSGVVKQAINTYGPQVTQTHVAVENVNISPLGGFGSIENLVVGNPKSFQPPENAISLGEVSISLEPASLLSDTVVIKEIKILDAEFNYSTDFASSNLQEILNNVKDFSGSSTTPAPDTTPEVDTPTEEAKEAGAKKKYVVKSVIIEGAVANASVLGQSVKIELPPISLQNEAETGITPQQVTEKVLTDVMEQLIPAIQKQIEAMAKDPVGAGLNIIKGAGDTGDEGLDKAADAIKGLFD